jgi:hypothetical protein
MSTPMFTPKQIDGLKSAVKQGKIAKTSDIIGIVGEVASVVVSTIFSVSNAKQKERMIEDLANLQERDFQELDEIIKRQKTQNERVRAYLMFFSDLKANREEERIRGTIGGVASKKSTDEKRLMKLIFGGAVALILIALVIKKIKK